MATRTVTINADGIAEREVMFVRYELNQQTDVEGQPTGTTRGGKIMVKVKSNDDGNTDLLEMEELESQVIQSLFFCVGKLLVLSVQAVSKMKL